MMYFTNFPTTYYEVQSARFNRPAEYVTLTDITRNVRFKKEVLDKIVVADEYIMVDNQTIDQVSEELYGSPYYHWVLMLLNDRFDYVNDFPLTTRAFEAYVENKYNFATQSGPYLDAVYGLTPYNLVVDIVDASGRSVDFTSPNIRVFDRGNGTSVYRDVSSCWMYDSTLKMQLKQFLYLDYYADSTAIKSDSSSLTADYYAGTYNFATSQFVVQRKLNTLTHRIDWGTVADYSPVYAYDYENTLNETKRKIRVISEPILQLVLQNFKDLM